MISAGDFRNGITIELEGNIYQIIEFQHVKPGKGAAFVRTKLKNIKSGGVVEKTFRPTEKCPQAHIERSDMQYLYSDDMYHFMNTETYDQIDMTADQVGDSLKFVKENDMDGIQLFAGDKGKEMMSFYVVESIPRFILLDKKGRIVDAFMTRPSNEKTKETLMKLKGI